MARVLLLHVPTNRPTESLGIPLFSTSSSSRPLHQIPRIDASEQEHALFEQRICEDPYGVAVRKINQHGKSNLRYVRCVDDFENRSVGSWGLSKLASATAAEPPPSKTARMLVWGKKKYIELDKFRAVAKGKTTDRARRCAAPGSRILSLIAVDGSSLDIEAPTRLDRDKFARAFSKFLNVPIEAADCGGSVQSAGPVILPAATAAEKPKETVDPRLSASQSVPGDALKPVEQEAATKKPAPTAEGGFLPPLPPSPVKAEARGAVVALDSQQSSSHRDSFGENQVLTTALRFLTRLKSLRMYHWYPQLTRRKMTPLRVCHL